LNGYQSLLINQWILSKGLISLELSDPSLLPPLIGPSSLNVSVSILPLSHLVGEVHGGEPVHETVFILEALLGHIKRLLHSHRECNTEGEYETAEEENDIYKVNMMRRTSWGAYKCQILKMGKTVVDKS
jgi:hypothetical protein